MKVRSGLALSFWLLMVALWVAILVLGTLNRVDEPGSAIQLLGMLAFGMVGPLIVVRRPKNLIGWLFCLDVLLTEVAVVAEQLVEYSLFVRPGTVPGVQWVAWIAGWSGDTGWALLFTFTFLLFPNGRLPSWRWRPLAWLIAAMIALNTLVAMFRPGPFEPWPALRNPVGLPLPLGFVWLTSTLESLIGVSVLVCVASLVWRFGKVRGEERQQIK